MAKKIYKSCIDLYDAYLDSIFVDEDDKIINKFKSYVEKYDPEIYFIELAGKHSESEIPLNSMIL